MDFWKAFDNVGHHPSVSWEIKEQAIKPAYIRLVFKFPIRSQATGIKQRNGLWMERSQ